MSLAISLVARPVELVERALVELRETLLTRARALALGGLLVAATAEAVALFLWAGERFAPPPMAYATTVVPITANLVMALAYALVGATLAIRQPRNPIGWLFLSIGLLSSFVPSIDLLAAAAARQYLAPSGTTIALAWLASNFYLPLLSAIVIVVFLIFPDGRALPGWSRAGWLAVLGAMACGLGQALDPSGLRWYPTLPNPTAGPAWLGPLAFGIQVGGMVGIIAALAAALRAMVHRYRSYSPEARHGLTAVCASVLALAATGGSLVIVRYGLEVRPATGEIILVASFVASTLVPIAATFGMLRYHLFDVDLVLAHALVYVPLTALLAGLYAASVALFTRIFVAVTHDSSDLVVVLATLVLASVFTPLRKALEELVDRHFKPARKLTPETAPATTGSPPPKGHRRRRILTTPSAVDPMSELHELQARLIRLEAELGSTGAAER